MTEDGEQGTQILLQVVPHDALQGQLPMQMAVETEEDGQEKVGMVVLQQEEVRHLSCIG